MLTLTYYSVATSIWDYALLVDCAFYKLVVTVELEPFGQCVDLDVALPEDGIFSYQWGTD